jgi:hypothetical protein
MANDPLPVSSILNSGAKLTIGNATHQRVGKSES